MQNENNCNNDVKIAFETLVIEDNRAWFPIMDRNGLVEMTLDSDKINILGCFPEEKYAGCSLFRGSVKYKNSIFFAPFSAQDIYIYHIDDNTFDIVHLKKPEIQIAFYNPNVKFMQCVRYDNKIFFISATYPAIVCLNADTYDIIYYHDIIEDYQKTYPSTGDHINFRQCEVTEEGYLLIPGANNDVVVEFNINEETYRFITLENAGTGFSAICIAGNDVWLSPRKQGAVIRWNRGTDQIDRFNDYPFELISDNYTFSRIYQSNGMIYLLPANSKYFIMLDIERQNFYDIEVLSNQDYNPDIWRINYCGCFEDKLYIFMAGEKKLLVYDTINSRIENELTLWLTEQDQFELIKSVERHKHISYESNYYQLNDYIVSLCDNRRQSGHVIQEGENSGKKIHDRILNMLKINESGL